VGTNSCRTEQRRQNLIYSGAGVQEAPAKPERSVNDLIFSFSYAICVGECVSVLLPLCMYVRLSVCFYLLTFDRVCVLPLCSLNRCILFSVFYVLPSGIINDDDDKHERVLSPLLLTNLLIL